MANMRDSDESFLSYVLIHSETPRHAFHRDDARRLCDLAGVSDLTTDNCGLAGFVGIGEAEATRLVGLASARLKRQRDLEILANDELSSRFSQWNL
jgi:hypothetical protein